MITRIEKENLYDGLHPLDMTLTKPRNINFIQTMIDCVGLASSLKQHEIEMLRKEFEFYITNAAINDCLNFKSSRTLALILGAGIAGLAASFELLAAGFNVIIAEKRTTFDRFNVINLDVESQRFLKKFGLLDEFEESVAGRIMTHNYVLFDEKGMQDLGSSDVNKIQPSTVPFEPEFFNMLFHEDGIYSVRIKDLQNFLAKKALEYGVHIVGNIESEILNFSKTGDVSTVILRGKDSSFDSVELKPGLIFIAEGTHSTTAKQLDLKTIEVKNECTGENWIFGNMRYAGKETFVISVLDASQDSLEIANIIFNAYIHEINIAVTSKKHLSQELIEQRILKLVGRVFSYLNINDQQESLIRTVKEPVHIINENRVDYSRGNVFCIGDAAGHSSPLAGMGGTLGLTLVPRTIEQLVTDSKQQPSALHNHFHQFTDAYTTRWISKSATVKKHCLSFFKRKGCLNRDREQIVMQKSKLPAQSRAST